MIEYSQNQHFLIYDFIKNKATLYKEFEEDTKLKMSKTALFERRIVKKELSYFGDESNLYSYTLSRDTCSTTYPPRVDVVYQTTTRANAGTLNQVINLGTCLMFLEAGETQYDLIVTLYGLFSKKKLAVVRYDMLTGEHYNLGSGIALSVKQSSVEEALEAGNEFLARYFLESKNHSNDQTEPENETGGASHGHRNSFSNPENDNAENFEEEQVEAVEMISLDRSWLFEHDLKILYADRSCCVVTNPSAKQVAIFNLTQKRVVFVRSKKSMILGVESIKECPKIPEAEVLRQHGVSIYVFGGFVFYMESETMKAIQNPIMSLKRGKPPPLTSF